MVSPNWGGFGKLWYIQPFLSSCRNTYNLNPTTLNHYQNLNPAFYTESASPSKPYFGIRSQKASSGSVPRVSDPATGLSGHGSYSARLGYTGLADPTPQKIARTSDGSGNYYSGTLSGGQKAEAQKATEIGVISFVLYLFGLTSELFQRFGYKTIV